MKRIFLILLFIVTMTSVNCGNNDEENLKRWDTAAEKVKAKHADFDEFVYRFLAPMLDPEDNAYDKFVKSRYDKLKDKSPASAYEFAKGIAFLSDKKIIYSTKDMPYSEGSDFTFQVPAYFKMTKDSDPLSKCSIYNFEDGRLIFWVKGLRQNKKNSLSEWEKESEEACKNMESNIKFDIQVWRDRVVSQYSYKYKSPTTGNTYTVTAYDIAKDDQKALLVFMEPQSFSRTQYMALQKIIIDIVCAVQFRGTQENVTKTNNSSITTRYYIAKQINNISYTTSTDAVSQDSTSLPDLPEFSSKKHDTKSSYGLDIDDFGYTKPKFDSSKTDLTFSNPLLDIKPNTYGSGVNSDQYGRATKYEVIGQPDTDTSLLKVKQDAYGSGVGMDQFGRPVKNTTWP